VILKFKKLVEEHCRQVFQMHLLSKNITLKLLEKVISLRNSQKFVNSSPTMTYLELMLGDDCVRVKP